MSGEGLHVEFKIPRDFSIEGLQTDHRPLTVMLSQLGPALRMVASTADLLLSGSKDVDHQREQALLLSYSGICVSFLWSNTNKGVAADLRFLTGAPDEEPKWLRDMRNSFIHVDERLMEIFENDPESSLSIWSTGAPAEGRLALFGIDAEAGELYSLARGGKYVSGSLRELSELFWGLADSANSAFMFFFFGGAEMLEQKTE